MINKHNQTPRKSLDYKTPYEVFIKNIKPLHFKHESIFLLACIVPFDWRAIPDVSCCRHGLGDRRHHLRAEVSPKEKDGRLNKQSPASLILVSLSTFSRSPRRSRQRGGFPKFAPIIQKPEGNRCWRRAQVPSIERALLFVVRRCWRAEQVKVHLPIPPAEAVSQNNPERQPRVFPQP